MAAQHKALLAWFDKHQRSLPWRHSRDPYRIWISEVMLQQTTVTAVIPYFERFLKSFPTVHALANATEEHVLRHWEGLGYYRRARHLHAAAKIIVRDQGGEFPRDPQVKLPGVGRYILGAVLSQAYEARLPIVEANSLRVLARYRGYRGDPRIGEGQRWVWQAAESLLPTKRIGDYNQALMELGALVCTPREPMCGECPLRKTCVAFREGLQSVIPPPKAVPVIVPVIEVAVAIHRGGKVLVARRPDHATRWANLWELPHGEAKEPLETAAIRIASEFTNLRIELKQPLAVVNHSVTRFAITMTAFLATTRMSKASSEFYAEFRWCSPGELAKLPTSVPQRKLFQKLIAISS